jgi:hypothetical protein
MAYTPSIPQSTDIPATSQGQILANFQGIKTLVDVNHITFDAVGQGKHNLVTMPVQGADPVTIAGEMALYTKSVGGVPNLFLAPQNAGTVINMLPQFVGTQAAGFVTFPGGFKMAWGTDVTNAAAIGAAGKTVNLATGAFLPGQWTQFSQQPTYQITTGPNFGIDGQPAKTSQQYSVIISTAGATSFTVWGTRTDHSTPHASYSNVPFKWLAVGI